MVLIGHFESLLLFIFAFQQLNRVDGKKLIFANVVWRHGDRSYMKTYPNDPYRDKRIWINGFGQLTNTGIAQQYHLGKFLRTRYSNFLSKDYLKDEIYVRSTDKDRTIMSAQSNMAGLYPPTDSELWNGSQTTWFPVPIHVVPISQDHLLSYPNRNCPEYQKVVSLIRHSPWYLEHEKKYSSFYKFIKNVTGLQEPVNLTNVWTIEDNIFCLKANNYTLPKWVTPEVFSTLRHLNSLEMGLMFTDVDYKYRALISKMQGGILLKQMLKNLMEHSTGAVKNSLIAYSAHDTTLTALLVAIGNYDWVQPGYASCVFVELYEDRGRQYVELYYRRSNGSMEQLQFYTCSLSCPLEEFAKISQKFIPDDHSDMCTTPKDSHFICNVVLIVSSICMFMIIIIGLAVLMYCKKGNKKSGYDFLDSHDESA